MIKKGTWVEIETEVLKPEERASSIPEETKKTPLLMWAKGWLLVDADLNENAEIETVTGRILSGRITCINPGFSHDFGDFVPEIMYIGKQARSILREEL